MTGWLREWRTDHGPGSAAQTFEVPAFWHVIVPVQVPQLMLRERPHRSYVISGPQLLPAAMQSSAFVSPAQPHVFGKPPPPQVSRPLHVPQLATLRVLPQLSVPDSAPHVAPMR
jgi:hypothetical protein